jgi:hypothetical protein
LWRQANKQVTMREVGGVVGGYGDDW